MDGVELVGDMFMARSGAVRQPIGACHNGAAEAEPVDITNCKRAESGNVEECDARRSMDGLRSA